MEEEHTTQWPKEKLQKDKQRSTTHTHTVNSSHNHKAKDLVTRNLLQTGGVLR